jgi:hypothetical protein
VAAVGRFLFMRPLNLLTACVTLLWSGAAAAQTTSPPAAPVRQPPTSTLPATPTPENQAAANPAANPANATARNRTRVAIAAAPNRRDCTQLRGIEKSECERRDTVRDDLPAGVTSTQKAPPR